MLNSPILYYVFHISISGRVKRTVCFSSHGSCRCLATMPIDVINCGSFYIYKTPALQPRCFSRICLEKHMQRKLCPFEKFLFCSWKPKFYQMIPVIAGKCLCFTLTTWRKIGKTVYRPNFFECATKRNWKVSHDQFFFSPNQAVNILVKKCQILTELPKVIVIAFIIKS